MMITNHHRVNKLASFFSKCHQNGKKEKVILIIFALWTVIYKDKNK
jgi:hypothetical protein